MNEEHEEHRRLENQGKLTKPKSKRTKKKDDDDEAATEEEKEEEKKEKKKRDAPARTKRKAEASDKAASQKKNKKSKTEAVAPVPAAAAPVPPGTSALPRHYNALGAWGRAMCELDHLLSDSAECGGCRVFIMPGVDARCTRCHLCRNRCGATTECLRNEFSPLKEHDFKEPEKSAQVWAAVVEQIMIVQASTAKEAKEAKETKEAKDEGKVLVAATQPGTHTQLLAPLSPLASSLWCGCVDVGVAVAATDDLDATQIAVPPPIPPRVDASALPEGELL
jgi:superfamily II DNA/RNA helicase